MSAVTYAAASPYLASMSTPGPLARTPSNHYPLDTPGSVRGSTLTPTLALNGVRLGVYVHACLCSLMVDILAWVGASLSLWSGAVPQPLYIVHIHMYVVDTYVYVYNICVCVHCASHVCISICAACLVFF